MKDKVGIVVNIEKESLKNKNYRKVLYTSPENRSQLVLMSLKPLEEIGLETHQTNDQFIRIEKGNGLLQLDQDFHELEDGSAFVVPAGTLHNVINISDKHPLKLYTLYTPSVHVDHLVQRQKPQND